MVSLRENLQAQAENVLSLMKKCNFQEKLGVLSKGLLVLRKKLLLRREDLLSFKDNLVLLEEIRYF